MLVLAPDVRTEITAAERLSRKTWQSNYRALLNTQPAVAELLNAVHLDVEWVFARDGSLSARTNGRWWADCSVPLLAGRTMLRSLPDESVGSCQLMPAHVGLVRAARERMGNCPVLFVAQPDAIIARMILSCHDFSDQIDRHRFWIVSGLDWLQHLERIFTDYPGLATPLRFIRTRLTNEELTLPAITAIQSVFSKALSLRGEEINRLKAEPIATVDHKSILLVGGTEFRLWEFGTDLIEQQLRSRAHIDGLTIRRFDMDDALCGSPLALLQAARQSGSVVAADVCRADCNQLLSPDIAWITWLTQPGAPPFDSAGPRDALILADEKWTPIARVAGWPASRIRVCGWPVHPVASSDCEKVLGFICDTRKIQIPTTVADFSSHRLLWELIEEELAANPLALEDVDGYLANRASQLNIAIDALDRPRFVEEMILPAYQQGLARMLISAGVSIQLWGKGWGDLEEFAKKTSGAVSSRAELEEAIGTCKGLIYCWPTRGAHPMEMFGKQVVYRSGMDRSALIREARRVIGMPVKLSAPSAMGGLAKLVMELIVGGSTSV
jgi:hypothetical protein